MRYRTSKETKQNIMKNKYLILILITNIWIVTMSFDCEAGKMAKPVNYNAMYDNAKVIIYGKLTNRESYIPYYKKYSNLPVVEIEILNTLKSDIKNKYVYILPPPNISTVDNFPDTERVLIYAEHFKDIKGMMVAVPAMKGGGGTRGVFRYSIIHDNVIHYKNNPSYLEPHGVPIIKIGKLFDKFVNEEQKIITTKGEI